MSSNFKMLVAKICRKVLFAVMALAFIASYVGKAFFLSLPHHSAVKKSEAQPTGNNESEDDADGKEEAKPAEKEALISVFIHSGFNAAFSVYQPEVYRLFLPKFMPVHYLSVPTPPPNYKA